LATFHKEWFPVRTLVSVALALLVTAAAMAPAHAQPARPAAKKATRNVSGTVRSSSADAVVVSGRDKGKDAEWTFAVEPTTNIRKGTKAIVAGDLKPGDAVQVRYLERDGKAFAESIRVQSPKKDTPK
jgi:hypothetical protein